MCAKICDFLCLIEQKSAGVTLKEEDVAVSNVRIDLTRGRHNPLERYLKRFSCTSFSSIVFLFSSVGHYY